MGNKVDFSVREREATNLLRLIESSGMDSQAAFARHCGVPGGKSMLSQHVKATRPISLECAIAYAIGLNRPLSAISPRLSAIIDKVPKEKPPPSELTLHEPALTPYVFQRRQEELPGPVREVVDLMISMDDVGKGMLLERARTICKERAEVARTNIA